jgi:hypothetical protein
MYKMEAKNLEGEKNKLLNLNNIISARAEWIRKTTIDLR